MHDYNKNYNLSFLEFKFINQWKLCDIYEKSICLSPKERDEKTVEVNIFI